MNARRLTKGLIILYIGIIVLLSNLDIIQFSWWYALSFWPVFLILIGINMLLPSRPEGRILSIMATCLALAFFTYQGLYPKRYTIWSGIFDEQRSEDNRGMVSRHLSAPMNDSIETAQLTVSAGAIDLEFGGPTEQLIDLRSEVADGGFILSKQGNTKRPTLKIAQKRNDKRNFKDGSDAGNVRIRLNRDVNWAIDFKLGAANADIDLEEFHVSDLSLDCGVSSIDLRMGMPLGPTSQIAIEGGLASITIELPKEAGCRVKSSSALSSFDARGFTKKGDFYETENYVGADKKIEISLKSGLSSIDIERY